MLDSLYTFSPLDSPQTITIRFHRFPSSIHRKIPFKCSLLLSPHVHHLILLRHSPFNSPHMICTLFDSTKTVTIWCPSYSHHLISLKCSSFNSTQIFTIRFHSNIYFKVVNLFVSEEEGNVMVQLGGISL